MLKRIGVNYHVNVGVYIHIQAGTGFETMGTHALKRLPFDSFLASTRFKFWTNWQEQVHPLSVSDSENHIVLVSFS